MTNSRLKLSTGNSNKPSLTGVLFVAAPVFLETIWVLESVYEITRLLKKYIEKLEENQIPNVTSFDSPI
jgi:predicted nucleic-acid-binding protein